MTLIVAYQKICQERVNTLLNKLFIAPQPELIRLYEAMRYSVMTGGKRVRPLLAYGACETLGGDLALADGVACAVELIHAYSLVHDDLPAMDNDDLRRGQPTTHKAYDEACAILVGDALQALAFEVLVDPLLNKNSATVSLEMIKILSKAAGASGMVGGQSIDLQSVGQELDQPALETMHRYKTGALIEVSVLLGALASNRVSDQQIEQLKIYSQAIGLAFQVQDDILDIESDTTILGKKQGADIAHSKPTYPALLGLEGARYYTKQLYQQAMDALADFSSAADVLRDLAAYIVERRF